MKADVRDGERPTPPGDTLDVPSAITRAKHEWECTVDALPNLVCLLDGDCRIVRINRVIEHWSCGSVAAALQRDPHDVLHRNCNAAGCELRQSLTDAWRRLRTQGPCEFEVRDAILDRALQVHLKPIRPGFQGITDPGDTIAVLVVADVTELHVAQQALSNLNTALEGRVRERTAKLADANRDLQNEVIHREAAEEALRASRHELAVLTQQLMNAQEVERKRIAGELHDSVGQALGAIKYGLECGVELARQARLQDSRPILARAIAGVQGVIEEIRSIAMNLRPSVLDDLGAASAVSWFCRKFSADFPSIEMRADINASNTDIPVRLATAVFRSVQELLNNVAKHAHAQQVVVALWRDAALLTLEVRDDGVGLDESGKTASLRHGHGIRNLRERADMTGGQFSLLSSSAGGTLARIEWRLATVESQPAGAAQPTP